MALLRDSDREAVRKRLEALHGKVRLVHFTQALECEYCPEAKQLLEEVAALSDKVELQVFNLLADGEEASKLGVDRVPGTAVLAEEQDHGIRFYGLPSGYEFGSLLETIHRVSSGESGLSEASKEKLRQIHEPILLQVFVTPT
jgi:glutaredoxin-like protein